MATHAHNSIDVNSVNTTVTRILGANSKSQVVKQDGKNVTARLQLDQLPPSLREGNFINGLLPDQPIKTHVQADDETYCLKCVKKGNAVVISTKHPTALYAFLNADWRSLVQA